MGIFNRNSHKSVEKGNGVSAAASNRLSNVIEIGASDASVGDSSFTLPFLTGLHNLGFQRAVDDGITSLTEEFLAPLEEHARGIAREYAREQFDPEKYLHDKMQFDEYNRALRAREDSAIGEDHAISRLRQAKAELDATKRVGDRPARPNFLLVISVIMVAVSLSATIHDRLMPNGLEPMLSIVLSMMIGVLLGAAPVYAIFHGRNSTKRWFGFILGIIFAVGTFCVRVSGVENSSEVLYAAGWALLELCGVLLAEYLSNAHRKTEVEWEEDHHQEIASLAAVASATEDVELWRGRIDGAQQELDRVSAIVHDRNSRALRVNDIENLCVKAVRDGASSGAAQNLGIVRGLKPPLQAARPKQLSKEVK